MKKTTAIIIFLIISVCIFASCDKCEHEYGEWSVIREPTCDAGGISERVCKCGERETHDIPMLKHLFQSEICVICGDMKDGTELAPGLYDKDLQLVASWKTLDHDYGMLIERDYEFIHDDNSLFVENDHRPEKLFYSNEALVNGTILVIPEGVEKIGKYAFFCSSRLIKVILPQSLKTIDDYAFYACDNLEVINLGNVEKVGEGALGDCNSLKQAYFTGKLKELEADAFGGCNILESVTLPDSLSKIGSGAFSYCESLNRMRLPKSLTSVPDDCFKSCKALIEVTMQEGIVSIGKAAFQDCDKIGEVHMPSTLRRIESHAYYESGLTDVYLNEGLTYIGGMAFSNTALEEIVIPDSVTELGSSVLWSNGILKSVTIGSGITTIPGGFAADCWRLSDVIIGENVKTIGEEAFSQCWPIRTITLPEGLTQIDDLAFNGCLRLIEIINLSQIDLQPSGSHPSEIDKYAINVHTGDSKLFMEGDFLCYSHNGTIYLLDYLGNKENPILPETIRGESYKIWELPTD